MLFLSVLLGFLNAEQVDFYANDLQKNGELVEANSSVLIFSDNYLISADRAEFNETSRDVELFGEVSVLRNQNERFNSCYAKVNLDGDRASFKDFFFADNKMEVWFQSGQSDLNSTLFLSKDSTVSSCNVHNPDWKIRFSTGELDRTNNYLHLYNARLYVKDTPVFYVPYLGFSLDTSRKSGLLIPEFEFNRDDGFYYNQPLFLAFYDEWDLEYRQQIRVNRGIGGYATLRFMDSPHSSGALNGGIFRERADYYEREGLKNQLHKGIELRYTRQSLFKSLFDLGEHIQEGVWIDGIYLNDVDYLNLEARNFRDLTSLVTSEFSYFIANENNYLATYAKYYIDTAKLNNKDTLQELPSVQYHRFLSGVLRNYIQYSFDATFNRYTREVGVGANVANFNLPLNFHLELFDDFLQFKFSEKLYGSFVGYTRHAIKSEHLLRNYHEFTLYTELAKPYKSFYHTIHLSANYLMDGVSKGEITQNFLNFDEEEESLSVKAVQFFYNDKGEKKFKQRAQLAYDTQTMKISQLKHLAQYFFTPNVALSNESTYSKEQQRWTKSISSLEIALRKFNFNFSHAYKYDFNEFIKQDLNTLEKHSFIGASADYTYNINYKFIAGAWFDTQRAHLNAWEVGYTYQRKCWNYSLIYKERTDPQLTSAGISAKRKNGVYFSFNFYPVGGVRYDLSLRENTSAVGSGYGTSSTKVSTSSSSSGASGGSSGTSGGVD